MMAKKSVVLVLQEPSDVGLQQNCKTLYPLRRAGMQATIFPGESMVVQERNTDCAQSTPTFIVCFFRLQFFLGIPGSEASNADGVDAQARITVVGSLGSLDGPLRPARAQASGFYGDSEPFSKLLIAERIPVDIIVLDRWPPLLERRGTSQAHLEHRG